MVTRFHLENYGDELSDMSQFESPYSLPRSEAVRTTVDTGTVTVLITQEIVALAKVPVIRDISVDYEISRGHRVHVV